MSNLSRIRVWLGGVAAGLLVVMLAAVLPALLLWTSWSAERTQQQQRAHFLRGRLAAVAARLETLPETDASQALEILSAEEPALAGLEIYREKKPDDGLEALWDGRQLFLLEEPETPQGRLMRAWIPFHCGNGLCVARIDMSPEAADFIVEPARRNLIASAAASLMLVVLSLLTWRTFAARQRALLRQAELEHLASIGRMSSVLAHEIRNPLGTIKGFAQLLEESAAEGQKRLAAPIVSEAARLERLVNDLLTYGRPREPQLQLVQLRPLVEQVMEEHARAGFDKRLGWCLEAGGEGIRMETDPDLLRQILGNLLRNAAEAAVESPAPEVRVRVLADKKEARIEVRDNGAGFTEETLRRAFEPFLTTKAMGTGLGLAICRRLARLLGGNVEVSNHEQGGALAVLRLPLAASKGIPDAAAGHRIHS